MARRIDPNMEEKRKKFKTLGYSFLIPGIISFLIGLFDFFSSFGRRMPNLFFLCFIGIILIGIGANLLRFAYIGSVTRYVASQTVPVASDSINYIIDETKENVTEVIKNVVSKKEKVCRFCSKKVNEDALFCNYCGKSLNTVCPSCNHKNEVNSLYCQKCGTNLC